MNKAKRYLVFAFVTLLSVMAWAVAPTGWTLTTSTTGDSTGCVSSGSSNGLCAVAAASGSQLWLWLNGGAPVQLYPSTSSGGLVSFNGRTTPAAVPAQGDYTFSLIGGSLTGAQMPASQICTMAITGFAQDGKGGASGTATLTGCK